MGLDLGPAFRESWGRVAGSLDFGVVGGRRLAEELESGSAGL